MFEQLAHAPSDPILGLTDAYRADSRPNKINLGVGVFFDDQGKTPSLKCVIQAEKFLAEQDADRSYLPINGSAAYGAEVRGLLFASQGGGISTIEQVGERSVTAQTPGGTGGLRVVADFLAAHHPGTLWLSEPTWTNHHSIFSAAGLKVKSYAYYDAEQQGINFPQMKQALSQLGPEDTVLFHGSCHNPTGFDPSREEWAELSQLQKERGFLVVFDTAYQGFGDGLDEDAHGIRIFSQDNAPFFVVSSFSKNFSLYNERVGALTYVGENADQAARVLSQMKLCIRTNYSSPPRHGSALVTHILSTPALRSLWVSEVTEMRGRLQTLRTELVSALKADGVKRDFSFLLRQKGMFSYTGLSGAEVDRLVKDFGIYLVRSGRINVAGITRQNLPYLVDSIKQVTQG